MFSKNLKYYRLKNGMRKNELARLVEVTPMAITHYENGDRQPNMDIIKRFASVLGVRVADFLTVRNENLVFSHGDFRKHASLNKSQQMYIHESVEEYFNRYMTIVEILGGDILPITPPAHGLTVSEDSEADAKSLRTHLRLACDGPVSNLTEILENKGFLLFFLDIDSNNFSGINGFVNGRPYIVVNRNMSPERNRSTIAHELAHLMFDWPDNMEDKDVEKTATAISGAFLFPASDAIRELGVRRSSISKDMVLVTKEYGVSMYLLVKRANLLGIITDGAAKDFYIKAGRLGWKKNEPSRIAEELPIFFEQLVYRAVNEDEISIQKGAELLQTSYEEVYSKCCFDKDVEVQNEFEAG